MSQEFFGAITEGDADKVGEMLKANPELASARDEKGQSAVLTATYYRKHEVLAALLAAGPELNVFEAAATGQTGRVRALIQQDPALVHAFAPDGFFPLALAVFFGHLETVEALLAAGAEVNVSTRETMKVTPLHSAATACQAAIARVLIAHGAKVDAEAGENGFRPLHGAAANGDLELVQLLLENGAEVNPKMTDGKTPLGLAVMRKQDAMAAFLRERGGVE